MRDLITDQDSVDGSALRRLREALPSGDTFTLTSTLDEDERHVGWAIAVHRPYRPADWAEGPGTTIAEAADRVRESLRELEHA